MSAAWLLLASSANRVIGNVPVFVPLWQAPFFDILFYLHRLLVLHLRNILHFLYIVLLSRPPPSLTAPSLPHSSNPTETLAFHSTHYIAFCICSLVCLILLAQVRGITQRLQPRSGFKLAREFSTRPQL